MTNIVHLAPLLRSPTAATPPRASRFLAELQQTLAAYIPPVLGLVVAIDLDGPDQAGALRAALGMEPFLRAGRGMAGLAQDERMHAAFNRALGYLARAKSAPTTDDLRSAFGLLAAALTAALAEADPALWIAAEPTFQGWGDGEGGAA